MPKEFIPFRKKQLQEKIFEARELGTEDHILFLESQWVHRYGIETLQESFLNEVELSSATPVDELLTNNEHEESETISQQNLFSQQIEETRLVDDLTLDNSKYISEDNEVVEASEDIQFELKPEDETELSKTYFSPVIVPPPPTPSIKHLRRWLPAIGDSISKAS